MFRNIYNELKHHIPFTAFGALTGIVLMLFSRNIPQETAHDLFYVFHPIHVLLSALATAGMYRKYNCPIDKKKCSILFLLLIGYIGSIGIATLSDSVMPYIGEVLLNMPHRHHHIGFIEKWWLVSSLAVIGVIIAYFNPATKMPHAAHVLVSTWASSFHILMAMGSGVSSFMYFIIFIFLFVTVWTPCCISDIVFPLLFVKDEKH